MNLISHFGTLKDFKNVYLLSPLDPLWWEIDKCAHGLFATKFNYEQLSLEVFFDVMRIFGFVRP